MSTDHITPRDRQEMYHLLAGLFLRPPSSALLELIKNDGSTAFLPGDNEALSSPWMQEIEVFREELGKMFAPVAEMEAEHTSLFVLPSGIIPHEAVYLDEKKRLGGRVTMAVARFYEDAAMEISDACIEMPDHLGMELEFMARLCGLEALFQQENDQVSFQVCRKFQQDFMNDHIGRWAPQCCEEIMIRAGNGFYRAVAQLTVAFLAVEQELLQESQSRTGKENWVWQHATV